MLVNGEASLLALHDVSLLWMMSSQCNVSRRARKCTQHGMESNSSRFFKQ